MSNENAKWSDEFAWPLILFVVAVFGFVLACGF